MAFKQYSAVDRDKRGVAGIPRLSKSQLENVGCRHMGVQMWCWWMFPKQ
jgi:hypothetical protein